MRAHRTWWTRRYRLGISYLCSYQIEEYDVQDEDNLSTWFGACYLSENAFPLVVSGGGGVALKRPYEGHVTQERSVSTMAERRLSLSHCIASQRLTMTFLERSQQSVFPQ
jgi:hypothetical protein